MKKGMLIVTLIACICLSAYNVSRSSVRPLVENVGLQEVEALAQSESGNDNCKERRVSSEVEVLSAEGSYRIKIFYECGNGIGSCRNGYIYAYFNQYNEYIGKDDQRTIWRCI